MATTKYDDKEKVRWKATLEIHADRIRNIEKMSRACQIIPIDVLKNIEEECFAQSTWQDEYIWLIKSKFTETRNNYLFQNDGQNTNKVSLQHHHMITMPNQQQHPQLHFQQRQTLIQQPAEQLIKQRTEPEIQINKPMGKSAQVGSYLMDTQPVNLQRAQHLQYPQAHPPDHTRIETNDYEKVYKNKLRELRVHIYTLESMLTNTIPKTQEASNIEDFIKVLKEDRTESLSYLLRWEDFLTQQPMSGTVPNSPFPTALAMRPHYKLKDRTTNISAHFESSHVSKTSSLQESNSSNESLFHEDDIMVRDGTEINTSTTVKSPKKTLN